MAPPLASTKKLTRKPSFAGWLEAAVVNDGLNGGHGQLDVDGLLPVRPEVVLTNCLEGNEAEVVAEALRLLLPTSSILTEFSSSSDDTGSAIIRIFYWKMKYFFGPSIMLINFHL